MNAYKHYLGSNLQWRRCEKANQNRVSGSRVECAKTLHMCVFVYDSFCTVDMQNYGWSKKMNKIVTTFLLSLVFLPCNAMVKSLDSRKCFIKNLFLESVEVQYYLENSSKQQSLLLTSGEIKEIQEWQKVTKLVVVPYGAWRRIMTRELAMFQLSDYQADLDKSVSENPGTDLIMTIESGATAYVPAFAKPLADRMAPYCVAISAYLEKEHWPKIPESRLLKDALPRVKEAFESKQEILPRYVLGVKPDASEETLYKEHKQLVDKWRPVAFSQKQSEAEFATNLIEWINLAYHALLAQHKFKELTDKLIIGKK